MCIPAVIPRSWTSSCHWWRRQGWNEPRLGRTRAQACRAIKAEGVPSPCGCVLPENILEPLVSSGSQMWDTVGCSENYSTPTPVIFILRLLVQWVIFVVSIYWLEGRLIFTGPGSILLQNLPGLVLMWLLRINCPVIGQNKLSCDLSNKLLPDLNTAVSSIVGCSNNFITIPLDHIFHLFL